MQAIRVVKKGTAPVPGAVRVYIGRGSVLGNYSGSSKPNSFGLERMTRDASIAAFKKKLWQNMKAPDGAVMRELRRISALAKKQPVELECFCAPLPCHGDVIKAAIEWLDNQPQ